MACPSSDLVNVGILDKKFQTQKMLEHKYLTDDVVRVKYETGSVYINYGKDTEIDGVILPEMDYVIV
jgi:hypothetical protein